MNGSDMASLSEINLLSEAIVKVEVMEFSDNSFRDAFITKAKKDLNKLLTMYNGI